MREVAMSLQEQEVYELISQSFIHLDTCDQQLMKRFGLTVTQSWALVHLENPEGRSLSELANMLSCDKSNVTGIVDKLEEVGLAERKRGKAGDRRYTRVVLTEQGHKLRRAVMAARENMVKERLGALKAPELDQLHHSLQRLVDLLQYQLDHNEVPQIIERSIEQSNTVSLSNNLK